MFLNNVTLQTQGFHPSELTKSYLQDRLDYLHHAAPSDSIINAFIVKKDKMFKGRIKVSSSAGSFFATASGQHIREVAKMLTDQIKRQLQKWKTVRLHRGESVRKLKFLKEIE
ncbi:MAG: hypothetical protein K1X29_09530 [Bdellovibrionales bacterium]|nr:hypothetical protein [Bdellovibrionales bacterium]